MNVSPKIKISTVYQTTDGMTFSDLREAERNQQRIELVSKIDAMLRINKECFCKDTLPIWANMNSFDFLNFLELNRAELTEILLNLPTD